MPRKKVPKDPPPISAPWWSDQTAEISRLLGTKHKYTKQIPSSEEALSWINRFSLLQNEEQEIVFTPPHTSSQSASSKSLKSSWKLRIYPNKVQIRVFKRWFDVCRALWNRCVELINSRSHYANSCELEKLLVTPPQDPNNPKKRILHHDCPRATKDALIRQFCFSYDAAVESLKKRKKRRRPRMKFRLKKDKRASISICPSGTPKWSAEVTANGVRLSTGQVPHLVAVGQSRKEQQDLAKLQEILLEQTEKKRTKKRIEINPNSKNPLLSGQSVSTKQVVLLWEYPNRWFLCFPYEKPKEDLRMHNQRIIALDPGVRTFQTGFSNKGDYEEFGKDDYKRFPTILRKCDALQSVIKSEIKIMKARKRKRLKIAAQKRRDKLHHIVTDVHWKLAKHLTTNYDVVMIPKFGVSKMVQKEGRRIGRESVRNLLAWRHFQFRQRLIYKAEENGCIIHEVTEEWTTKCCGVCGRNNHKIGSSKVFNCESCGHTADRDRNAARNIFMKNIVSCEYHYERTPLQHGPVEACNGKSVSSITT